MYAAYFSSRDFSQKKTKAEFYLGRLSRILPNYYLALFMEIPIVFADIYNRTTPMTYEEIFYEVYAIISSPFMLQGWVLPTKMAYVSWIWGSLMWAMSPFAFYWFLFPWLLRFVEKERSKGLDFLYLFICYILSVLPYIILWTFVMIPTWFNLDFKIISCSDCIYWWIREFPPIRLSSQLMGMFLAKLWITTSDKVKRNILNGISGDIALGITLLCALYVPYDPDAPRADSLSAALDTCLSPLQLITMWALACRKGLLSYILSFSVFRYCGKMSYGIWAYQFSAYYVFAYFGWNSDWYISLIAFFMLVGASSISLEFFEDEARKKISNLRRYFPDSWK